MSVKAKVYFACKCLSTDAKQIMSGALKVAQTLAEQHLKDIETDIWHYEYFNESVPSHLPHMRDLAKMSVENLKKLNDEVSGLPTCEFLKELEKE
jgi:hypothetical protein